MESLREGLGEEEKWREVDGKSEGGGDSGRA